MLGWSEGACPWQLCWQETKDESTLPTSVSHEVQRWGKTSAMVEAEDLFY